MSSRFRSQAPWGDNRATKVLPKPSLKDRVHAFRYPLSPKGRVLAGLFYFSVPILLGVYVIMPWANSFSEEKWGNGRMPAEVRARKMQRGELVERITSNNLKEIQHQAEERIG